jgi:hypothetical protein
MVLLGTGTSPLAMLFHLGDIPGVLTVHLPSGTWESRIDSADSLWLGPGVSLPSKIEVARTFRASLQPRSFVVLERSNPSSE